MRKIERPFKIIFCIILAILIISICSKNSPLYCFNDWVDANAFFTVGKGWANGLIPYKDLFEQKGPLLYLIYMIGYLISNTNFIGIYILEVFSLSIFNYYILKTLNFIIEKKYSYLIIILLSSIIVSSNFFVHGGSAEEFCLPLIAYSSYSFFKYMKNGIYDKRVLFINGLIAGLIALIKFNLLGFWFIWMALIFFNMLFKKEYKNSIFGCLIFLLGMLIPILIAIIYFGLTGALKDFIEAYVTFNFEAYTTSLTFMQRIKQFLINFEGQFLQNRIIFHLIVFGFISTLFTNIVSKNTYIKLFIILSFLFLGLGIYIGGEPYNYYFLLNEYYMLFGIVTLFILIRNKFMNSKFDKIKYMMLIILTIFISYYQISKCLNLYYLNLNKDYFAQYTFNKIIKKNEKSTILNYDNLDGGFYTVSNVLPNTKYFMRQNISYERYPKILDEQNRLIKKKLIDFVIIREYYGNIGYHSTIPYLNQNYYIVKEQTQLYEGMEFTYLLYKKKGN